MTGEDGIIQATALLLADVGFQRFVANTEATTTLRLIADLRKAFWVAGRCEHCGDNLDDDTNRCVRCGEKSERAEKTGTLAPATHDPGHPHLFKGEFQSDKYPSTPRGKVPLSTKDTTAQDLLWEYAQRRRKVDEQFSDDLEIALRNSGYTREIEVGDLVQHKRSKRYGRVNAVTDPRGSVWVDGTGPYPEEDLETIHRFTDKK